MLLRDAMGPAPARALAPLALVCACLLVACGSDPAESASNGGSGGGSGTGASGGVGGAPGGGGAAAGSAGSGGGSAGFGGLSGAPTLKRIGDSLEVPTWAGSAPKRFVDAAYDPSHDVYLIVHGNSATGGAFVDADAAPVGAPFAIADGSAWTQGSRVAYADKSATFLAAWNDNREGSPKPRARTVRWTGSQVELGNDFALSTENAYQEMGPGIGYSAVSDVFLVAWHRTPNDDIVAARVSAAGQLMSGEIVITQDSDWQSDAAIAWSPDQNQFLVGYSHAAAAGAEIRVQRVNAATGALIGAAVSLTSAKGTWLPQLAWLPASHRFFAAWYEGKLMGRFLDQSAQPVGAAFALAPGYGNYDGFALAYHPALGAFAAVFHGNSYEDFAMGLGANGELGPVFEATKTGSADGNFNPRVVANAKRPEWLLVTSMGYQSVVAQRIGP